MKADAELRTRLVEAAGPVQASAVDVCVLVREGPLFRMNQVTFVGNKVLSPTELLHQMTLKAGAVYEAQAFEEDVARISSLCFERGLVNCKLHKPEVSFDSTTGLVSVTIKLDEGPVYHFGKIGITGQLAAEEAAYQALLQLRSGDVVAFSKIAATVKRITDFHAAQQRTDLRVLPMPAVDKQTKTMDVTFTIQQ